MFGALVEDWLAYMYRDKWVSSLNKAVIIIISSSSSSSIITEYT